MRRKNYFGMAEVYRRPAARGRALDRVQVNRSQVVLENLRL